MSQKQKTTGIMCPICCATLYSWNPDEVITCCGSSTGNIIKYTYSTTTTPKIFCVEKDEQGIEGPLVWR